MESVVNCVAYDQSGHKIRDISIETIREVLALDDTFVWVGLHEPGEDLLRDIQEEFGLHDLAVEDAHRAHQRPKIEAYGDSLFIVLKTAQFRDDRIYFGETHLFLGKRYLVSIRHGASMSYAQVRNRCETTPDLLRFGSAYALYAVMDFLVDNYSPVVDSFEAGLKKLESDIFSGNFRRDTIEQLYQLKRELVELRLAVVPVIDICNQLTRSYPVLIGDEVRPYFRDISDHAARVSQAIDVMREMVTAAMEVNLSMVTVHQNEIVKKLAGWAGILAFPTLVVSYYGMNFHDMPELGWPYAYPVVVGLTVLGCILLYRKLRRDRWL